MAAETMAIQYVLHQILTDYGTGLLNNPPRLKAILLDYASNQRREIILIIHALQEGVGGKLLAAVSQSEAEQRRVIMICEQILEDNLYVPENVARMAVGTIWTALGMENVTPKAKKQESAEEQYELARRYYWGNGVEQNYNQAFFCYQKAAEQGYLNAQNKLGLCYGKGIGVRQDYSQAAHWYQKAAEQGCKFAQFNLGFCYETGQGVKQDYIQAIYWYKRATEHEHEVAKRRLSICYEKIRGGTQDYTQSEEQEEPTSAEEQYKLAERYYYGNDGVERDYSQAVYWYQEAAEQGHREAQYELAELYDYSDNEELEKEAAYWYQKAAEQGHKDAQFSLALCYTYGTGGVEEDHKQAAYWYQKAAEQGYPNAQYNLGICYEKGDGVERDYGQAIFWYNTVLKNFLAATDLKRQAERSIRDLDDLFEKPSIQDLEAKQKPKKKKWWPFS